MEMKRMFIVGPGPVSNRGFPLLRGKTTQSSRIPSSLHTPPPPPPRVAEIRSGRFDEENPFVQNSSVLLVQPDEGVSVLVMDRIGDYLPQSTEKSRVLVIPVGARHKCQQDVGQIPLDEESLSVDDLLKRIPKDMMLPSVIVVEPVKIKFSHGISITGVTDGDWFKENLPKIAITDKGKAPLVEPDTIKGHPDREMFHLICSDIEFLAENASLKNSSAESSSDELEDTDSLKTELSKLRIENELLRSESSELKAEVEKLTKEMSSWTQSARAFHKLQEIQKSAHDRTGLGFSNSESSEGETSTQSQPVYDKFNKMSFVKANVIYDCFESVTYDDQNSPKLSDNGKAGIGFSKPESSKPNWLKNKLDKDKAKASQKPFVPNQSWRSSKKMMTAIHFGLKVNWSKVLFNVLKDMVDKSQRKAKGFAAQIGVLLKGIPAIALGEGVSFPFAKILSIKTVNTYIATNTTIDAREEQGMIGEATDVVPIQVIDPTSAVETIKSPAPKRISQKRRLVLPMGSDDEKMGTQELAKDTDEAAVKPTDEVDIIIEQVLEETLNLGVNEEEHGGQGVDETMFAEDFAQWLDDFVSRNSEPEIVGTRTITGVAGSTSPVVVKDMNRAVSSMFTNEELMSIDALLLQISDDMLLPSITATEITKIRLGEFFSTNEVQERDVHLTSLPRISTHDTWKAILEEDEPIRGNPASELVELICGDIEFLIRIRDQRWTATTSQIIDLLSDAHSISLEDLLAQQRAHGLPMEQPCASTVFDSSVDSGAALARFYSVAKSTCWVRPMILIDGVWTPLQGPDFCKSSCRLSLFLNQKKMPEPVIDHIFVPHILLEPVQYWEAAPLLIRTWQWTKATYQPQESSSSSTDVSMHFDSADIPLNAQADSQASAPVDFTMFADALEDLRSSISQRIHDSNCEILYKVNAVEIGVREALLKQHALLHQSLQDACRVQERQGVSQAMQINDLKKGLLAPVATVFQDLMAIKKGQREQDAKITALDTQVAARRGEQLDFQSKIAADILSLSTQFGDIVDYIRGGDVKKGEIGSSSRRPLPVRVERRPLPTQANQGESSSGHGRVPSMEEAAEMVREADRQADRWERVFN
ncbi:hypothetical protein F511_09259 [Dorcoceras hygrometricum]|uniref:Uncharacterized protein n=1 Tax=Dorcoceras hygrometricum TaxID=472368 RepID=A0A2Z7CUF8_9LAMI|nr:hypothetical protein F511_09259 [Dorcoceras hygrometricum]